MNPWKHWIEEQTKTGVAPQLATMHRMYGTNDAHTCGECKHLITRRFAGTYYKCDLTKMTAGSATDWRKKWTACGAFEKGGEG
jgi:hypothetical protein